MSDPTPTQIWQQRTLSDKAELAVIDYLESFGLTPEEACAYVAHHLVSSVLFNVGETVRKAKGLDDV